eukprot:COSAG04_NODE_534_length_12949_cov_5.651673_9_plen_86_part_00
MIVLKRVSHLRRDWASIDQFVGIRTRGESHQLLLNPINQEVVIHEVLQGSTPGAKEEQHGQVRQRPLHGRSAPLSGRQSFLRTNI